MTNFEIFSSAFSQDKSVRDQAQSKIFDAMKNPEFLDFLLSSLMSFTDENSIHENILIIQSILIVFHEYMKIHRKKPFFQDTQIQISFSTLMTMLFNFPVEIRHLINNILSEFLYISKDNNEEFINICFASIEAKANIFNMTFALRFLFDSSTVQSKDNPQFEAFSCTCIQLLNSPIQFIMEFFSTLPKEFIQYLQMPNDQNKAQLSQQFKTVEQTMEFNLQFLYYSAKILCEIKLECLYTSEEFQPIITCFANFLGINIEYRHMVSNVKKEILHLFTKIQCLFKNVNTFRPAHRPFVESFQANLGPLIIISILNCFETHQALSELLFLVFRFLKQKIHLEIILVPDFITKVLFPASILADDDIQNFEDLPEHFIEFCLIFHKNTDESIDSIRQCLDKIIEILPIEFIQLLLEFLSTPSSTPIESEAKIFLTTLIVLHHQLPIDLFPQTIDALAQHGTEMPLFHYSSLLVLLSLLVSISEEIDESVLMPCLDIAIFALLNCESAVVRLCSIDLLNSILDQKFFNEFSGNVEEIMPLSTIIEAILKLTTDVRHEFIGGILEKLVYKFPTYFVPINLDYIQYIFTLWTSLQEEDDDKKTSSLLLSITQIISALPQNSPLLAPLMVYLTPAVLEAIPNYYSSVPELIDILGCLSDKIDEPPSEFYMLILTFLINSVFNIESSDDQTVHNYEEYSVVICSLITRANFFSIENAPQGIVKIIEACFASDDQNLLTTGFMILTCFLQAASKASIDTDQFFQLIGKAIEVVRSDIDDIDDSLILSSILLISTGLIINAPALVEMIDPQFIDTWISKFKIDYCVDDKFEFLHWTTLALLLLSGFDLDKREIQLFQIAVEQFIFLKNAEITQNNEHENALNLYPISFFPFDDVKCDEAFNKIENNDPRLTVLDEQTQHQLFMCLEQK